jgi:hypothetical protein
MGVCNMVYREHIEQNNPNVRHTFRAENIDLVGWKSWKVSSERQVRQVGFLGWESWNRAGAARDFTAVFVLADGSQLTPNPARQIETGYAYEEWSGFGIGPPEWGVEGLDVTYEFEGQRFPLEEGKNWITIVVTLVVLFAIIAVAAAFVLAGARDQTGDRGSGF